MLVLALALLPLTAAARAPLVVAPASMMPGRGFIHLCTFQLNLSALYGIGGARRGCVARVKGVFRMCRVFFYDRHGSS